MTPEAESIIKKRYFDLYRQENIGKTPEITKELDHIESVMECERVIRNSNLALPSSESSIPL